MFEHVFPNNCQFCHPVHVIKIFHVTRVNTINGFCDSLAVIYKANIFTDPTRILQDKQVPMNHNWVWLNDDPATGDSKDLQNRGNNAVLSI